MRLIFVQIFLCGVLLSCTNSNKDRFVNISGLTEDDYRLFQATPVWELAKAVRDENEEMIDKILKREPGLVNFKEPKYGNVLINLTIFNQQIKSFKLLLKSGADIDVHNTYDGTSPLIHACMYKMYDIKFASILIQNGANVNDVETGIRRKGNSTRFTPLMAASREGNLDLVKLLVSNGANVNYRNEFKQSALSLCVMQEYYQVAIFLLNNGADYTKPVFFRPGNSADYNPDEDQPMFLVDVLREDFFDLQSKEYKYKMQIVDFLQTKGIDYWLTPIPESIRKKAKDKYPFTWKKYLDKY